MELMERKRKGWMEARGDEKGMESDDNCTQVVQVLDPFCIPLSFYLHSSPLLSSLSFLDDSSPPSLSSQWILIIYLFHATYKKTLLSTMNRWCSLIEYYARKRVWSYTMVYWSGENAEYEGCFSHSIGYNRRKGSRNGHGTSNWEESTIQAGRRGRRGGRGREEWESDAWLPLRNGHSFVSSFQS